MYSWAIWVEDCLREGFRLFRGNLVLLWDAGIQNVKGVPNLCVLLCKIVVFYALLSLLLFQEWICELFRTIQRRMITAEVPPPYRGSGGKQTTAGGEDDGEKKRARIAVIGGGIAGSACAWSLGRKAAESRGFSVELFEQNSNLGGNARVQRWDDGLHTGLSVLAWPDLYFHNYNALTRLLGIPTTRVRLPFMLSDQKGRFWSHEAVDLTFDRSRASRRRSIALSEFELNRIYTRDLKRWLWLARVVRCINNLFTCDLRRRIQKFFTRRQKCFQDPKQSGGRKRRRSAPPHQEARGAEEEPASFYKVSMLNPCNLISLKFACRFVGISEDFWRDVVVPIYSSTFLTVELDSIPLVILPIIEDIISLGRTPVLRSWKGSSTDVFEAMFPGHKKPHRTASKRAEVVEMEETPAPGEVKVHLNSLVTSVQQTHTGDFYIDVQQRDPVAGGESREHEQKQQSDMNSVNHSSSSSTAAGGKRHLAIQNIRLGPFSQVVFATNSHHVSRSLHAVSPVRRAMLKLWSSNLSYTNQHDDSFLEGIIHQSPAMVLPRPQQVCEGYANYVEQYAGPDGEPRYENTFCFGSWVPAVQNKQQHSNTPGQRAVKPSMDPQLTKTARLVTYNAQEKRRKALEEASLGTVENVWNHPCFGTKSLFTTLYMTRFLQRDNIFFCGSFATPSNGHDLSLCSGLAVACRLGADYPFQDDPIAHSDFQRLRGLMGL